MYWEELFCNKSLIPFHTIYNLFRTILAGTIGIKNPIRYRGYYYDVETALYYLQSRYYDPETGRFINPDAYLIAGDDVLQGTNMYAYCYNNPVMYVDPSGYESNEFLVQGFAVIFGGIILAVMLSETVPYEVAVSFLSILGSLELSAEGFITLVNTLGADLSDGNDLLYQGTSLYGEPNSEVWVSKNTKRLYGPDGRALKDTDYGDNHPDVGTPHDHNWTWGKDGPTRGDPIPHTDDFSLGSALLGVGLIAVCSIGIVALAADDTTGIGVTNDFLIAPLASGVNKGLALLGV